MLAGGLSHQLALERRCERRQGCGTVRRRWTSQRRGLHFERQPRERRAASCTAAARRDQAREWTKRYYRRRAEVGRLVSWPLVFGLRPLVVGIRISTLTNSKTKDQRQKANAQRKEI